MRKTKQEMGYRDDSPYNGEASIRINSPRITMNGVGKPLMAYPENGGAYLMQPGMEYDFGDSKSVLEVPFAQNGMPVNNQSELPGQYPNEELEAILLELHLSSLSESDQDIFIDEYRKLSSNHRMVAIDAMAKKHKKHIRSAKIMQSGGFNYTPLDQLTPDDFTVTEVSSNKPIKSNTVDIAKVPNTRGGNQAQKPVPVFRAKEDVAPVSVRGNTVTSPNPAVVDTSNTTLRTQEMTGTELYKTSWQNKAYKTVGFEQYLRERQDIYDQSMIGREIYEISGDIYKVDGDRVYVTSRDGVKRIIDLEWVRIGHKPTAKIKGSAPKSFDQYKSNKK